jgi:hypothetical protein
MASALFNPIGHVYTHEGRVVPSVTQVLTLAGLDELAGVPRRCLARAAALGTAVHSACEFLDQDDLDLDSLDAEIVGYVLGWQKFKQEHEFSPVVIERRGISAGEEQLTYGFCLDRIGILGDREVLVDIKTGSKAAASWAIQTAAYAEAENFDGERMSVHVAKDGSYTLIPHPDENDFAVWHHALEIAHWRLGHGARIR